MKSSPQTPSILWRGISVWRVAGACKLALLLAGSPARGQGIGDAIRTHDWQHAAEAAAALPDRLPAKLVLYLRLLEPGQGNAAEIAAFMAANPDWPALGILGRRLAEALEAEADAGIVEQVCAARPDAAPRCADAADQAGRPDALAMAERAWVGGIDGRTQEARFLARWRGRLPEDASWTRFVRLAWGGQADAVGRLLPLLRPDHAGVARNWIDLHDDAAGAAAPAGAGPLLWLEQARSARRGGDLARAATLWAGGGALERSAPPEHRAQFWIEREALVRLLLAQGDDRRAYAVAADPDCAPEKATDALFLAGWIALRRLQLAPEAAAYFAALASHSNAAITQGRAHYWLARALAADPARARAEYAAAAAWPTTFYGQLAAVALDGEAGLRARVLAARDPGVSARAQDDFEGTALARAAILLTGWGDLPHARGFLRQADRAGGARHALVARLALRLGLPDQAVAVARLAGRDGAMLPQSGWPIAERPPPEVVDAALALGISRQESSFDPSAESGAGAVGLMQVMPATGRDVAREMALGAPDLRDPLTNLRIGGVYFRNLLDRFDGVLPAAIAAYNAGPARVRDWSPPDQGAASDAVVDWIETIPFAETRNYVQRVMENVAIYRAKLGEAKLLELS